MAQEDLAAPGLADSPLTIGFPSRAFLKPSLGKHRHRDSGDGFDANADNVLLHCRQPFGAVTDNLLKGNRQRFGNYRPHGVWRKRIEAKLMAGTLKTTPSVEITSAYANLEISKARNSAR